jgi:hypothetical protein
MHATRFVRRVLVGAVLLVSPLAGPVDAQSIPSPYRHVDTNQEAGLFAGYNFFVAEGQFGIGPKPGPLAGGRYGISIGGPFSLEGLLTYLSSSRDVLDPGPVGDEFTKVGEADVQLLTAEARIKFMLVGQRTWRRLSPHVLVGAGITFELAGGQPADQLLQPEDRYQFGNSFSGLLGLGGRWFISRRILLRSELTLQLWQQDIPSGYRNREALVASPDSEWIQAWGISAGIAYNF